MSPLVFVAVDPCATVGLRDQGAQPHGVAYAATPMLRDVFGYGAGQDEEADYAAQLFASLAGLASGWDRCVLAVRVPELPPGTEGTDFGQVELPPIRWEDVTAVFFDDVKALPSVRAYAETVRGRGIGDIWADRATDALVADHDLLWFAPSELDDALAGRCRTADPRGD
jgi:hypothetical protein